MILDVIKRVMAFGASAFIPKSAHPAEIGKALSAVIDGELSGTTGDTQPGD